MTVASRVTVTFAQSGADFSTVAVIRSKISARIGIRASLRGRIAAGAVPMPHPAAVTHAQLSSRCGIGILGGNRSSVVARRGGLSTIGKLRLGRRDRDGLVVRAVAGGPVVTETVRHQTQHDVGQEVVQQSESERYEQE